MQQPTPLPDVRHHRHRLLTWSRATGDVADPLTLMEVGPAAFEEIDLATGGVGAASPPAAA